MSKKSFSVLWFLWLLLLVQGCAVKYKVRNTATITLEGEPITLQFSYHTEFGSKMNPLRDILETLEEGKYAAINKPRNVLGLALIPLEMAVKYALDDYWYNGEGNQDTHFYAAQYLLAHGADPDVKHPPEGKYSVHRQYTATHTLCFSLRRKREVDIRGLSLFLSYGARLAIKDEDGKTPIDILESTKPWIPAELREQLDWETAPSKKERKRLKGEQKRLKKEYFTEVAEALCGLKQYRKPVDPKFLKYIKKAGVDSKLVNELSAREPAA